MHVIKPAELLPGASAEIPNGDRHTPTTATHARVLKGRALVFWDPARPGQKLDAIDTDQITPAPDCVSESLDRLDERWKAGAFRHLMPNFRARVHRGDRPERPGSPRAGWPAAARARDRAGRGGQKPAPGGGT